LGCNVSLTRRTSTKKAAPAGAEQPEQQAALRREAEPRHGAQDHRRQEDRSMSKIIDSMNNEHIKALIEHHSVQHRSEHDMAEASRRGRLLQSEPEKSLPDVPLHKRGFGVMDEDGA
jgi:hypothetical protein